MTREEALKILKEPERVGYNVIHANDEETTMYNIKSRMAIGALEQEPKTWQFAKWVADEIFDDNWEYNKA